MVLVGLFATFALSACESAPKWVRTGNDNDQDSKAFYGVGRSDGHPERTTRLGCS